MTNAELGKETLTLAEIELQHILWTYQESGFNKAKAARTLGIGIRTLQRRLKKHYTADNPDPMPEKPWGKRG